MLCEGYEPWHNMFTVFNEEVHIHIKACGFLCKICTKFVKLYIGVGKVVKCLQDSATTGLAPGMGLAAFYSL